MGYEPLPLHEFGGLNVRDAPDVVGASGAVDLLNVEFPVPGAIRQRTGFDNWTTSALTNRVESLCATEGRILAGCGTRLEASSGAATTSQTGLGDGLWDFARFGAPGASRVYAVNGANAMYEWDGTTWATSATNATMRAKYATVMAVDQGNRMVLAGFPDSGTGNPNGGQSYTSQVWFSDAGAPETYGANNYVQLTPGDGETIQAVVAWREYVIVFKESKFFVFYGTSTDATGQPVFNYRTVDTGVSLTAPRGYAVAPQGVYFANRTGIYLTTGGEPTLVSDAVRNLWRARDATSIPFLVGGSVNLASWVTASTYPTGAMHYHDGRLYLAYTSSTVNDFVLVHDPADDWWSLWNIAATSLATKVATNELLFGYATGSNHIGTFGTVGTVPTDDDGVAITSRYRSGFYDFDMEQEKTVVEASLWGSGTVGVSWSTDFGALDTASNVTLGTSPAIAKAWLAKETTGDLFSHRFSSVSGGAWVIHRFTPHLRESRPPGINQ